ncbi:DUF2341 domain-containing protein [Ketobacter sp. MCCC 1A13808]|uniref:DUF2341 domain-containing protein n=1 Tax=Ketobacter sp. MCCC 1A13808 TaxID=2602738 RepID=UPI0012EC2E6D|nr:DUF2341 domain-containing protein [Ketobacter sp. MCCC 1A13808]MVF12662.1 DUF2341 domain-containing protein [Ketobacter sp. MCCC 1A13808]
MRSPVYRTHRLTYLSIVFIFSIILTACGGSSGSSSALSTTADRAVDDSDSADTGGEPVAPGDAVVVPRVLYIETDSGLIDSGRIADSTVQFHGLATPLATVQLTLNAVVAGTTVADDDGHWMLDYRPVELEPGTYSITVKSELLTGQVSLSEQPYVFEYNPNLPPEPPVYEPGITDFVIRSPESGSRFGWALSGSGDLNGDGFEDWVVSAPDSQSGRGEVIVVWGRANESRSELELPLSEADGFSVFGLQEGDLLGESLAVGDFNADGVDDLIMSAPGSDSGAINAGAIYVVWGLRGVTRPAIDLNQLPGFTIQSTEADQRLGQSSAITEALSGNGQGLSLGDFNADGVNDLLIGHPSSDRNGVNSGLAYLIWGEASAQQNDLTLSAAGLGGRGFMIQYTAAGSPFTDWYLGQGAQFIGDLNADGIDDLALGAPGAGVSARQSGAVFVVYGNTATGRSSTVELSTMSAAAGMRVEAAQSEGFLGYALGSAEFNGDGIADLVVSQPGRSGDQGANQGSVWVVYGAKSNSVSLDLDQITGPQGTAIAGAAGGDFLGHSISGAGDINGDGLDDLILGAYRKSGSDISTQSGVGGAYLVLGSESAAQEYLDLNSFSAVDGLWFLGVNAGDGLGHSVTAGDTNGDGFSDIAMGSPGAGQVSVYRGRNLFSNVLPLTGNSAANNIVGTSGADQIEGSGGADAIAAGAGDDRISVSDTEFFRVDGGRGTDTLELTGQNISLDITRLNPEKLNNIERIDLKDQGNSLILNNLSVLGLSSESGALWVDGGSSDYFESDPTDDWLKQGTVLKEGVIYQQFGGQSAQLFVNVAMTGSDEAEFTSSQNYWFDTTDNGAGVTGDVFNVPVLIRIRDSEIINAVQPGAADIRFVASDGITPLPYEVERWDQLNNVADVWVLVPKIEGSNDQGFITLEYDDLIDGSVPNGESPEQLWADYSGVWHFSDGDDGNNAPGVEPDSSPNRNHAQEQGRAVTKREAFVGQGVRFRDDATLRVPYDPSLNLSGRAFSVESWYTSDTCTTQLLFSRRALNMLSQDGVDSYWSVSSAHFIATITLIDSRVDRAAFSIGDQNGDSTVVGGSLYGLFLGDCSEQVVTVYDPLVGVQVYINGELRRQGDGGYQLEPELDLVMGGNAGNYELVLDETRVSRRRLDPDFIKLSYENQKLDSNLVRSSR